MELSKIVEELQNFSIKLEYDEERSFIYIEHNPFF